MNIYIYYVIFAFIISLISGAVLIPVIIKFCRKHKLYDLPDTRKLHNTMIPRLGGIAFLPSMLFAFIMSLLVLSHVLGGMEVTIGLWSCVFIVSIFIIYSVGVIDDLIGLGPKVKFLAQTLSALLLPLSGLYINNLYGFLGIWDVPFYIGAPLTVFVLVYIDNAINLIDGIDGLAGGLAVISLLGFLFCFMREGVWAYSVLIAGLIGVLTAYLYFNVFGNPESNRKIFMGDSGSLTLGFVLGFLFVKFAMDNSRVMTYRSDSLLLSYTLLIVPCFDVVRVMQSRLRDGQPLFKADKRHIHHKLLRCGLSQHRALVTILGLQVSYVIMNVFMYSMMSITYIVALDILVFMLFNVILNVIIKRAELK